MTNTISLLLAFVFKHTILGIQNMLAFYAIVWILSPNVFKKTDPWLPLFLFYSKVLALF
jgi:hypothetical protein